MYLSPGLTHGRTHACGAHGGAQQSQCSEVEGVAVAAYYVHGESDGVQMGVGEEEGNGERGVGGAA